MIPDYVKMNMDMSLSPDVDKFLKNEKIEDEEVDWLGEVEIENVLCEIGIQKDKKNIVVMSPKICFSVSVEELIRRHTRSE